LKFEGVETEPFLTPRVFTLTDAISGPSAISAGRDKAANALTVNILTSDKAIAIESLPGIAP